MSLVFVHGTSMQEDDLHVENVAEFRIYPLVKHVYSVCSMTTIYSGLMLLFLRPDGNLHEFVFHHLLSASTPIVSVVPPHRARSRGEQTHSSVIIPCSPAIVGVSL